MSRRHVPFPLRQVLLVALSVALLGACTHQRTIPDEYGDTTRDNFQEGCVEALTVEVDSPDPDEDAEANGFLVEDLGDTPPMADERASEVCLCSYEGISNPETGIPFEEFKEANEVREEGPPAPLPEDMQAIVTGCLEANAS